MKKSDIDIEIEIEIEQIVTGFHAKTLPKEEWTHEAHLITGLHAIQAYGLERSTPLMRDGIKSYNLSVGGENTDVSGYHETITLFFLHALNAFVTPYAPQTPFPQLVTHLLESPMMERPFILQFYRQETIFSVDARRQWVEPDIQPLQSLSKITRKRQ